MKHILSFKHGSTIIKKAEFKTIFLTSFVTLSLNWMKQMHNLTIKSEIALTIYCWQLIGRGERHFLPVVRQKKPWKSTKRVNSLQFFSHKTNDFNQFSYSFKESIWPAVRKTSLLFFQYYIAFIHQFKHKVLK